MKGRKGKGGSTYYVEPEVDRIKDEIIEMRRHIHQNTELVTKRILNVQVYNFKTGVVWIKESGDH